MPVCAIGSKVIPSGARYSRKLVFSAYRPLYPGSLSGRAYGVRRLSVKSAGSRLAHQREGKQTEGMGWVRVLPMRCNSDMGHKVMTSPTGRKPCSSSAIVCSVTGLQVHCTLSLYTDTLARPAGRPATPRDTPRAGTMLLSGADYPPLCLVHAHPPHRFRKSR